MSDLEIPVELTQGGRHGADHWLWKNSKTRGTGLKGVVEATGVKETVQGTRVRKDTWRRCCPGKQQHCGEMGRKMGPWERPGKREGKQSCPVREGLGSFSNQKLDRE